MYEGRVSFISKTTGLRVERSTTTDSAEDFQRWFNLYSRDTVCSGFRIEFLNEAASVRFIVGTQRVYSK